MSKKCITFVLLQKRNIVKLQSCKIEKLRGIYGREIY